MRIAYVCADPGVPVYGRKGSSVHLQEVIRALLGRGCQVELFAARVDGDPPPGLERVAVHRLPAIGKGAADQRERRAVAANAVLRRSLTAAGPFDLLYERYSLWSHAGMAYARHIRVPCLLEVNAPLIDEQARHRELVDRALAERIARSLFATATAIVAVSEPTAAWVVARSPRPSRVHVVPNGVDPRRFAARPNPDPEAFTVGFVGTLKPWHGVDTLVRAFALLAGNAQGCRLLIVGDGPQRDELERIVADHGLAAAVTFTGAVDPARVPTLLAGMDVATAPYADTADDYFSPMKLYEYLAAGLPVVASDVGQVAPALAFGRAGMLVPAGDPQALAQALQTLREDPQRRAALGAAGRSTVLRSRTWDAVAARIIALATTSAADSAQAWVA